MKYYINALVIVCVALGASLEGISEMYPLEVVRVAPTTIGDNSIVEAIKSYSNLTQEDVDQYKLLKLGSIGTLGAFTLGMTSAAWAGKKVYEMAITYPEALKSFVPTRIEGMQEWVTGPSLLASVGSAVAGAVSYKILYPRIRAGVLYKVQRFINLCEGLRRLDNSQYSIAQNWWINTESITPYLPEGWAGAGKFAVYTAFDNLAYQATCANALLIQLGPNDPFIKSRLDKVQTYKNAFDNNKAVYTAELAPEIQQKNQETLRSAQLANIHADTSLKTAGTRGIYASMFTGAIRNSWNVIKTLYDNKEVLGALGLGVVSTVLFNKAKDAVAQ